MKIPLPFSIFRGAGATGHVFLLNGGKVADKGLAYSGFVGPMTIVAVVPTTAQILEFAIQARTRDNQTVTVTGNVKVALDPKVARTRFDFTVNAVGAYEKNWQADLRAIVVERLMAPVRDIAKELNVSGATAAEPQFEAAIRNALAADKTLVEKGVQTETCAVAKVTAKDDVAEAIGATERQELLAGADRAMHDRRTKAADNDRAIRTFEAETALKLEEERKKLIEKQGENRKTEAAADAEATKLRLAPFADAKAGNALAAALMRFAETGNVGTFNFGTELFTAMQQGGGAE